MPEPLTMPARAPATPAAHVGVTAGSGAADAGAFEIMLQAGLAGRAAAATGTAVAAGPAAAKPAATRNAQAGTAAIAGASDDRSKPQNASGDDGASDSLAALLAYGPGVVVTASPAADGSEHDPSAPAASPALTDQRPDAATAALAAAMAQPTLVQPTLVQPTLVQPTLVQPTLGQPTLEQPTLEQPTLEQPTLGQPTLGQPTPEQPTLEQPTLEQPTLEQPTLGQPTLGQPATELVPNRDDKVDASATAAASAARAVRTPGGDAPQRDRVAAAGSGDRTQRDLPGIPRNQPVGLTQHLTTATEAGTGTAKATLDTVPPARTDTMPRTDLAGRLDTPPPAPERAGPVPVLTIDHSLGSPEWQREFVSQASVLVSRREPQAEIRLNPPQLGPVEVRIGVQGDQVSLAFTAPQPDTRAAIENALPQLREMFAGSGLALGNASVSAESPGQQSPRDTHPQPGPFQREEPVAVDTVPELGRVAVRLVDTFA